jgi:hypothetical protein
MTIATKVAALLTEIRRQDVEALSPVERQRFASLCRFIAGIAERQPSPPRPGAPCEFGPEPARIGFRGQASGRWAPRTPTLPGLLPLKPPSE